MRPNFNGNLFFEMSMTIKIKKGFDIKLVGSALPEVGNTIHAKSYALKPGDFVDVTPKLLLREGAKVKAGEAVFCDKDNPEIKFCSPVSGEIAAVVRGEKRRILEIVILADAEVNYLDFGKLDPKSLSKEDIKSKLLESGAWPLLVERPFGVVANPNKNPKNIFITGISSAPLAANVATQVKGESSNLQAGVDALSKLTEGKVFLSLDADNAAPEELKNLKGVEINYFSGPHPKGNIGVQMHNLAALNKGETAIGLTAEDLAIIGRVFTEGKLDMHRTIALSGAQVSEPKHYKVISGAAIASIIDERVKEGNNRYISGNVLTGTQVKKEGFLGFYSNTVTVILEGDEEEFLGWVLPGFGKFSLSRTFFSWLNPNKKYNLDTNMHGEERAYVVTGQYETVFPFDIFPVQLIKSIMMRDIEKMEQLGIYEVTEEDFALCEVICSSKIPVQKVVREGLNFLRAEVG